MTWEQEMAIQSNEKAKELAQDMAQEIAQDMAQEIAQDMAQELAQDMAQEIAQDMAQDMTNQKVIETAQKMLKEKIRTPEQISIVTSIPLEKILELKKKMQ